MLGWKNVGRKLSFLSLLFVHMKDETWKLDRKYIPPTTDITLIVLLAILCNFWIRFGLDPKFESAAQSGIMQSCVGGSFNTKTETTLICHMQRVTQFTIYCQFYSKWELIFLPNVMDISNSYYTYSHNTNPSITNQILSYKKCPSCQIIKFRPT